MTMQLEPQWITQCPLFFISEIRTFCSMVGVQDASKSGDTSMEVSFTRSTYRCLTARGIVLVALSNASCTPTMGNSNVSIKTSQTYWGKVLSSVMQGTNSAKSSGESVDCDTICYETDPYDQVQDALKTRNILQMYYQESSPRGVLECNALPMCHLLKVSRTREGRVVATQTGGRV
jgi:hypothetical protein